MNPVILSILNLFHGQIDDIISFSDFDTSLIFNKIFEIEEPTDD